MELTLVRIVLVSALLVQAIQHAHLASQPTLISHRTEHVHAILALLILQQLTALV